MGLKRFDYKIKDNGKKKSIIVASIIVLVLIVGVTIYATFAAYKVTNTYNIIQGKVGEFSSADLTIKVKTKSADNVISYVDDFPSKDDYYYDSFNSSCANGSEIEFDTTNWNVTIKASGKDNCELVFNEISLAANIINNAINSGKIYSTQPDLSADIAEGEYGLYKSSDDLGDTYYYYGDVPDNYIKFGTYKENSPEIRGYSNTTDLYLYDTYSSLEECDSSSAMNVNCSYVYETNNPMYWRIVRINGDGTIRAIYDGTSPVENDIDHIDNIGNSVYNTDYNLTKYVGYTYDTDTESTIKGYIDDWYEANLKADYGEYIADGIFCNDRGDSNGDGLYDSYERLYESTPNPSFTCNNPSDRYSNTADKGNALLSNPVGLLTADELAFAKGGMMVSDEYTFILSMDSYWTMTPVYYDGDFAGVWNSNFGFENNMLGVGGTNAVRPVINIKADALTYGNGSINNPYRLTE